jgi:hypothetical protein
LSFSIAKSTTSAILWTLYATNYQTNMRKNLLVFICFPFGLLPHSVLGQVASDSTPCYTERFLDASPVFSRIEWPAGYKGGERILQYFLLQHIDARTIALEVKPTENLYADTAKLRFIVGRNGKISELTVEGTKTQAFKKEVIKAIKLSSCFWEAGNNGGRLGNSWCQLQICYTLERGDKGVAVKVDTQWYENVSK